MLPGGEYEINPYLFDVATVADHDAMDRLGVTAEDLREITIEAGETGVVVTHMGVPPANPPLGAPVCGHDDFRKPWEFLAHGGQLGVQQETLPEGGVHALNPWFAHVVRVPTRELLLQWSDSPKESYRLDAALGEIELTVEGYTVRLGVHQTIRIPASSAPPAGAALLRRVRHLERWSVAQVRGVRGGPGGSRPPPAKVGLVPHQRLRQPVQRSPSTNPSSPPSAAGSRCSANESSSKPPG